LGNHDEEALNTWGKALNFNEDARAAILWTKDNINYKTQEFLYRLRPMARMAIGSEHALLVHGSPRAPMWEYMSSAVAGDAFKALEEFGADFGLYGHTHQAAEIYRRNSIGAPIPTEGMSADDIVDRLSLGWVYSPYTTAALKPNMLEVPAAGAWMNAGSTGQPRDYDKRASWLSLQVNAEGIVTRQIHRVEYDIREAQQDILEAGLPVSLAERLERGS
jgi:diadenosine tetraphosphatase ApaH/serine/threonine PP2A family protein phosphatase